MTGGGAVGTTGMFEAPVMVAARVDGFGGGDLRRLLQNK